MLDQKQFAEFVKQIGTKSTARSNRPQFFGLDGPTKSNVRSQLDLTIHIFSDFVFCSRLLCHLQIVVDHTVNMVLTMLIYPWVNYQTLPPYPSVVAMILSPSQR